MPSVGWGDPWESGCHWTWTSAGSPGASGHCPSNLPGKYCTADNDPAASPVSPGPTVWRGKSGSEREAWKDYTWVITGRRLWRCLWCLSTCTCCQSGFGCGASGRTSGTPAPCTWTSPRRTCGRGQRSDCSSAWLWPSQTPELSSGLSWAPGRFSFASIGSQKTKDM